MRGIELFAGIGGISLAAKWAGIETVAFCECETFCQKVLSKNFPGIPIFDNVCTLNRRILEKEGVIKPNETIDILSGGYPCQGESYAGKQKGEDDKRWLWPEMFRLTKELHPNWVVGENVAGHVTMGMDKVMSDLESEGYETRAFVFPAFSVGAPHQRYRTFVVANTRSQPESQKNQTFGSLRSKGNTWSDTTRGIRASLPSSHWEIYQPPVIGVDDGIPHRVDRSIALGNAVVPQQIYPILKTIVDTERQLEG
ncbi:DNA cytosine methyltransferase [Bacillus sonorensis]|uniref:DNA cytosine methyltransferase n=1 Tax=Bacillus sonorensis TaxID=119858 RepID=UPI002280957A|nr:DNA cytosine methyltransferase [Bacillus sonorensis]MCZ0070314.1 DNA cytosine methyltransferase [Bacillus sonorensis]MCZ0097702.1 DNA cytosine methyltransferase [Bacillus sonorensis]MEC1518521.1 DNA cytosine methyltransferase [Bacillus sonorensis]